MEDEPDIREIAELSLGLDPGFETRSCGSGAEALSLAADWAPDLILLDVMMPAMDGPMTLAHLRRDRRTQRIPVVFMTARAQAREIDMFQALGAAGVIPKPFDPLRLAAKVRAHLQSPDNRMGALVADFHRRLGEDAAALTRLRPQLDGDARALECVRAIAHGLAGASGLYNHDDIGDAAADLEDAILATPADAGPVAAAIDALLARIHAARHATPP